MHAIWFFITISIFLLFVVVYVGFFFSTRGLFRFTVDALSLLLLLMVCVGIRSLRSEQMHNVLQRVRGSVRRRES